MLLPFDAMFVLPLLTYAYSVNIGWIPAALYVIIESGKVEDSCIYPGSYLDNLNIKYKFGKVGTYVMFLGISVNPTTL